MDTRTPVVESIFQNSKASVVIPVHNEVLCVERVVKEVYSALNLSVTEHEIIVVDDGSTDGTLAKVAELCETYKNIRAISFSRNFGKEAALLAGLKAARGDVVITIDADLQHPPARIPDMLAAWRTGAKVVHAVKQNRDNDGVIVRWRGRFFYGLLSALGGVDVRGSSDFKLLDREVVEILIHQFPEKQRFFRGLATWVGYRQVNIPFDVDNRLAGRSKWSVFTLTGLATTAIVSFTSAPLRIVTTLGLVTLIFGAIVATDALWTWFRGVSVSGFTTLIITLLMLGSFIMISLGILGEYVAKIYDEIKQRPPYLIQRRIGFEEDLNGPQNINPQNNTFEGYTEHDRGVSGGVQVTFGRADGTSGKAL